MNRSLLIRSFLRYTVVFLISTVTVVFTLWMSSFFVEIRFEASHKLKVMTFFAFVFVNTFAAFIYSLWKTRSTSNQIHEIEEACDAISQGIYSHRLDVSKGGEIGVLAKKINQISSTIERRFVEIQSERTQLKMILASMIEGIVTIDDGWRIVFCNTKALKLLGIRTKDYRGQKLNEVQGFEPLIELIELAKKKKHLIEKEHKSYSEKGKKVIAMHAVNFTGEISSGIIIVLNDISQIRRLQKMRRDFVANVSHELKTPLTAIKGYTETLLDGALEDKENNRRFVEKISSNTDRLLELIHDVLSLAKLEESEGKVDPVPVDWLPVITSVVESHEDLIQKSNLVVNIRSEDKSCIVLGDEQSMRQILDNLLTNAIRYTPNGGRITIHLSRKKSERKGVLTVEDTGVGIPQKALDRVFERFYLVDKARSSEVGGTGLGLSIVKHLVQSVNGEVGVESELGAGSRFTVTLDLAN